MRPWHLRCASRTVSDMPHLLLLVFWFIILYATTCRGAADLRLLLSPDGLPSDSALAQPLLRRPPHRPLVSIFKRELAPQESRYAGESWYDAIQYGSGLCGLSPTNA